MDLFEHAAESNAPELSVAEISGSVKKVIEGEFSHVRVRGEVGRVYVARSGHLYFDLKDDRHVLAAVSWKGQASRLTSRPEEGMEVIATGKLTTFGSQSKYQLNVEDVQPAGEGALMAMLERRRKVLAAEGLFDPARKQPLPMLPEIIGVVTSPTGAVIRDILHRLRERFPRKVLVWPVAVQGPACAAEVARAIEGFNRLTPGGALPRPDLLIVARGGGSIEDLWGFNEEIVVRAAAASQIPLISAVGHETDTTLIDYVSDQRAPTPTAAAEFAVPVRMDLMAWSEAQGARMVRAMGHALDGRGQRLRDLARGMPRPDALTQTSRQQVDMVEARMPRPDQLTDPARRKLDLVAARRPALAPIVALRRQRFESLERAFDLTVPRSAAPYRTKLQTAASRMDPRPLRDGLVRGAERLSALAERMDTAMASRFDAMRTQVEGLNRLRESMGYKETLRRGYAVVHGADGLVTTAAEARAAGTVRIEFADGEVAATPDGQG